MAGNPMMLNKFFDNCTRTDISTAIQEHCQEKSEYSMLVVGSPNAWEVKDISAEVKAKTNLVCVDISNVFKNEFDNCTTGFKSSKFISSNIFTLQTDLKFDFIVNRWFLHHLTTQNKKDFFLKCKDMLLPEGMVISIDYFFTQFSNMEERLQCAAEYNKYRSLYSPEPSLEKFLSVVKDAEVENYRGGKMDCISNIQAMLSTINLVAEYCYTSDSVEVENPELWGHYLLKVQNEVTN